MEYYDEAQGIDEGEAREMTRRLAREEGIFSGTSTGLNVVGALQLACTILLVRETYGWHRPWARLTRADFCKLTPIKSRATVGVALNAVEARGFFYRAARRSRWTIWGSKQFWPNWGSKCQNEASKSYPPLATPRNHLPLDNNTPSLTRDENKSMFGQFS